METGKLCSSTPLPHGVRSIPAPYPRLPIPHLHEHSCLHHGSCFLSYSWRTPGGEKKLGTGRLLLCQFGLIITTARETHSAVNSKRKRTGFCVPVSARRVNSSQVMLKAIIWSGRFRRLVAYSKLKGHEKSSELPVSWKLNKFCSTSSTIHFLAQISPCLLRSLTWESFPLTISQPFSFPSQTAGLSFHLYCDHSCLCAETMFPVSIVLLFSKNKKNHLHLRAFFD